MSLDRFSVIIPAYNEEGCIRFVIRELQALYPKAEIIVVNDGSTDGTLEILKEIEGVTIISFDENKGQGISIRAGIEAAKHETCVLMDGDGQYDPSYIDSFVEKLDEADLVYGFRRNRKDSKNTIFVSKVANRIRRIVLRDSVKDTGCGLKALRRCHRHLLPYFEGTHRYIPTIFFHAGLKMIEVPIEHRERYSGKTKYTHTGRALRGVVDLIWMRRHINRLTNSETIS